MRRWSKVQSPRQGTYGHPPGFPGCCTCPPGLGDKSWGLRAKGAGCEAHAGCRVPWALDAAGPQEAASARGATAKVAREK